MIGNDIVDLKQITSNWKRPRFLEKVFTQNEQTYIAISKDQHQMVWLLWSMKEAAYKCHLQRSGKRFFNPKRLVCELISEDNGIVYIEKEYYFTNTVISENYIYTIASQDDTKGTISSIFESEIDTYDTISFELKQQFLKVVSEREGLEYESLSIQKTKIGVPNVLKDSEKLPIAFSLTHCGRFSGYVIC